MKLFLRLRPTDREQLGHLGLVLGLPCATLAILCIMGTLIHFDSVPDTPKHQMLVTLRAFRDRLKVRAERARAMAVETVPNTLRVSWRDVIGGEDE